MTSLRQAGGASFGAAWRSAIKLRISQLLVHVSAVALTVLSSSCALERLHIQREGQTLHIFDRVAGQPVGLDCELRVKVNRPIPFVNTNRQGGELSVTMQERTLSTSPHYFPRTPRQDGSYFVWHLIRKPGIDVLAHQHRVLVVVKWHGAKGEPSIHEPMEVFDLPPLREWVLNEWTVWKRASALRQGTFAWWHEAHQNEGRLDLLEPIPWPFELRCRALHWRTLHNP